MRVVTVRTAHFLERYVVVDAGGEFVQPAARFLKHLDDRGYARNTLRAYAYGLAFYFTYLAEHRLSYETVGIRELAGFVYWMKLPHGGSKVLPAHPIPQARAERTINAQLSAVTGIDPIPLDDIDAVVGSLDIRPVGTVLISDDLSNPGSGVLPATSDAPALWDYGYRNGGYEFVNIDPNWAHYGEVPFGDFEPYERISVDVALRSDEPGQVTYIGCRRASNEANGYRLLLDAPGRRAVLERLDSTRSRMLGKLTDLPNIAASPAPNHIELVCGSPTIRASVNGILIASADDVTYTGGRTWLGASNLPNVQVTTDAVFSNLVVTQD